AANVRWKGAQTALAEAKLKRETGEVIPVDHAREVWAALLRGVKNFVLSIAGRFAFETPMMTPHERSILERICRDGLEDLAMVRGFQLGEAGERCDSCGTRLPMTDNTEGPQ